MRRATGALALSLLVGHCAPTPSPPAAPSLSLHPVPFVALPGWEDDHLAEALKPFLASCAAWAGSAPDRALGGAGVAATLGGLPSLWRPACHAARDVPANDAAARAFFETWFEPYALAETSSGSVQGLFTGYYEPEVRGSAEPAPGYAAPLLARPSDLVKVDLGQFAPDLKGRTITGRVAGNSFIPYYDRAAIVETGALDRRHLELVWLADPVDAFVLQIQGSGRVRLSDGRIVRVAYDGENGRPYVPIGSILIERGEIPRDKMSMQAIRRWLADHPGQAASLMDQNPSYVFFRELRGVAAEEGPPGSLGATLTPGRSAAIDRHFLPIGAPLFVATSDPVANAPIRRLFMGQDTGGAIKGPIRADLFWGWDHRAEELAGRMHEPGTAFLLLPHRVSPTS